jgi:hypothetical protein
MMDIKQLGPDEDEYNIVSVSAFDLSILLDMTNREIERYEAQANSYKAYEDDGLTNLEVSALLTPGVAYGGTFADQPYEADEDLVFVNTMLASLYNFKMNLRRFL